tara:strand:- start:4743 stop:4922 length:180 start_codon:yes stop_codon:yes gene_type:complete
MSLEREIKSIEGETFDHYRKQARKINDAIRLLVQFNYQIIDMENKFINKDNINKHTNPN